MVKTFKACSQSTQTLRLLNHHTLIIINLSVLQCFPILLTNGKCVIVSQQKLPVCASASWGKGGEEGWAESFVLESRALCSLICNHAPKMLQKHHSKNHGNRLLISYRFYTDPLYLATSGKLSFFIPFSIECKT